MRGTVPRGGAAEGNAAVVSILVRAERKVISGWQRQL